MCGPNQGEVSAAGQSQATANLLAGNYIQNNGQQQQILNTIRNAMTPVVSAGPEQAGFAGPEAAALNSQAVNNAAASARDVQQAARAGAAGGTALTPAQLSAIQNTSLSSAAGQLAQTQNNNTIASAQVGANRFAGAVTGLNAVAKEEDPSAVAGNLIKNQGQTFKMLQSNAQAGAQQFGEIAGGLAGVVSAGAQLGQSINNAIPGQTPAGGYGELQSVSYGGPQGLTVADPTAADEGVTQNIDYYQGDPSGGISYLQGGS
jgi:hypothetical protein